MKLFEIFITFTFLLAFALQVSAQSVQFPNELKGYEFLGNVKLNQLRILTSTQENTAEILGGECSVSCEFGKDWNMSFQFISEKDNLYGKPFPKDLIGKLYAIEFYPRNKILLDKLNFSGKFRMSYEGIDEPALNLRTYRDNFGLNYTVVKNAKQWEIVNIRYGISERAFKDLLKEVKKK
ncbi:MAG: hypothetical protein ABJA66_12935 [Actinomycetota bacterium]